METRAHYALIGAFTLAVIAAAFMFVFWFSGGRTKTGIKSYQVVFSSSVSGLSRGSRVLFNGLNVGEVKAIDLAPDDPRKVYARIEVAANTPVKEDTKARLEYQGLTGVASIALIGGSKGAKALEGNAAAPPEILAERSDIQNILKTVQSLSGKVESTITKVDKLIGDNSVAIGQSIKNVEKFTAALADNSDGVGQFMASISELGKTLKPAVANIEALTKNLNTRVAAIEPDKIKSIVANADKVSSSLAQSVARLDKLVKDNASTIDETVKNARDFSKVLAANGKNIDQIITALADVSKAAKPVVANLESVTKSIDTRVKAIDPEKIKTILANADNLALKLSKSADTFDKFFAANSGPLTETVKNARDFSKVLANNGKNIDQIIAAFADVSKSVKPVVASLESVSKSIDTRVKAIDPEKIKTILANADTLALKLSKSADTFDKFFTANSKPLTDTIKNAKSFSGVLAENSDAFKKIIANLGKVSESIKPVLANLEKVTASIDERVNAIESKKITEIVTSASKLTKQLAGSVNKFDKFFDDNSKPLTETVKNVQGFSKALADNKEGVQKLITSLSNLGKSLEPTVKNLETLTGDISKRVAAVDTGKVKAIVDNAAAISSKLIGSADKLDKVLAAADKLLGSGDSKGAMAEITAAAKAIRILAKNLDARTRIMARGINRFTGAGLRQYQGLAIDGRRTLRQLNQTIKSLKSNPQQVIFGPRSRVPEYRGR